jgi:hypothetical protein
MKHTFWLFNYFFPFRFQENKDAGGQKCGLTREIPFTRIVGGTVAKLGEFPWMASLGSFNEDQKTFAPFCGKMWQNVTKCDNTWQHVTKCDKMWQNVTKCDKMWQKLKEDQKTFAPFCGGSLIGSSHLITAAHCLFGRDGEQTIEEFIAGYANK